MTINKDFKRLVRARMAKTGESYSSARATLLKKKQPIPANYRELAGMSDTTVRAKTGRDWRGWVRLLDAEQAAEWPHRDIARFLHERHGIPGWWAQMVTVAYERIRGLRDVGQRRDGGYDVNKSKTIAVPLATLYRAARDMRSRRRWLADEVEVRKATPGKTIRLSWHDGTPVEFYFSAKGPAKSTVTVQHRRLPDKSSADRMRHEWHGRLELLHRGLTEGW